MSKTKLDREEQELLDAYESWDLGSELRDKSRPDHIKSPEE